VEIIPLPGGAIGFAGTVIADASTGSSTARITNIHLIYFISVYHLKQIYTFWTP
jgi:hypothetical protein